MAISDKAWDGRASNYADTPSFCDACLINTNTGNRKDWTQDGCKLPVKEPNGDINKNALSSALAALNGARNALKDVSASDKKAAAKKLLNYYRQASLDIPDSLKNMAQ